MTADENLDRFRHDLGLRYPGIIVTIDLYAIMPDGLEIEADSCVELLDKLEDMYPDK